MIQAICWTLIHSLWQGLLFALVTGMVMLLTRQASAAVRYNMVSILFLLFLAVCGGTFLHEWTGMTKGGAVDTAAADTGSRMALWIDAMGRYCSEHAVPIVWGWLFIFSVKSLHMLGGYLYAQRVRHYGISAAPVEWQDKLNRMCRQMGIRRAVRLMESQVVKMPLVMGHMRPVILMPLGLITGLPTGEIEAVLLHELAHISRNDYIVNFIQNVAVNLFFFNPGLLWMSSLLREERENCCDDIAIAKTHNRVEFVRALINFKEHDLRLARTSNAFPGRKDQLVKRVMRIAQSTKKTLDPVEKIFLAVSLILISLLVAATSGSPSKMPIKMAQIPGGKYRFFVDTPVKNLHIYGLPTREAVARQVPAHRSAPEDGLAVDEKQKMAADARMVSNEEEDVLRQKETRDEAQRAMQEKEQALRDKQQAERDRRQIDIDALYADKARQQAVRDARQAGLDVQQAKRDADQATRDKEQQRMDDEQAVRDREQAIRDKIQAKRDVQMALQAKAPKKNSFLIKN